MRAKFDNGYHAKWRANNADKVKAITARHNTKHKEAVKLAQAKYKTSNPEKIKASQAKYRKHNPDKIRASSLKRNYGITFEDKAKMYVEQNGVCCICLKPVSLEAIHIDHDHETGYIRGLLCLHCNVGLGNFSDNAELLYRAIEYLCEKEQL